MPESSPKADARSRSATLIAAAWLLVALALVVFYTSRRAFLSPVALVVVAAIGVAALLLQLRLRPDLPAARGASLWAPLWLNILGVLCALAAVFADVLHLSATLMLIAALAAVVSFGVSGIIVISTLRKRRV